MAELHPTRPAIHVVLIGSDLGRLAEMVGFGAEEEGVPIRVTAAAEPEPVAAAYAAARASAFGIGVAIGAGRIVLHEGHMPPERPVLADDLGEAPERVARRHGGNAARMVVRLPLRLAEPVDPEPTARPVTPARAAARPEPVSEPSDDDVRRIVAAVLGRLADRGASR